MSLNPIIETYLRGHLAVDTDRVPHDVIRQHYKEFADEMFKDFVLRMMRGWMIRESSYVLGEGISMGHYTKDEHVAMLEAFEGDKMRADFAGLFGYWANDIKSLAAEHLHLAIKHGEVVAIDPPPQDGGEYWYDIDDHVWYSVERDVVDLDAPKVEPAPGTLEYAQQVHADMTDPAPKEGETALMAKARREYYSGVCDDELPSD